MKTVMCPQCRHTNADKRSTCQRCGTPLPLHGPESMVEMSSPPKSALFRRGQLIASRYVVQDLIGRGGMGCIYKVHDNTLKETVALKTLLPEYVRDKLVVERFFNEARIARALSHPHIVRVHDIGSAEDTVYISMEYLQGRSLREVLERLTPGQRLDIKTVLRIFDELCDALTYAHRYTVHRDIKPENVMIGADGKVKLMDFGISKLMTATNMTAASMVMGTPHYMSPEQLRNSASVDGRADIYSVGVMLYEVLTGNTPTGVPKPASEMMHEVPPSLDPIIEKCLHPDPGKRFQNAVELKEALGKVRRTVEAGSDVLERPVTARPRANRQWMRQAAAGVLLLAIVAGAAAGLAKAEERRKALLISSDPAAVAIAAPSEDEFERIFAQWTSVAEAARARADAVQRQEEDADWRTLLEQRIAAGDTLWELSESQRGKDEAESLRLARNAVHYYLAVVRTPQGMLFIPPGQVAVQSAGGEQTQTVDAFCVDEEPVTVGAFYAFCEKQDWRWPSGVQAADSTRPMTNVTYYDAAAFAALSKKEGRLPTSAEWTRATEYAVANELLAQLPSGERDETIEDDETDAEEILTPLKLISGGYEWTSTVRGGGTPDFRKLMVVRGGAVSEEGKYTELPPGLTLYEGRAPNLGFRCVVSMPATIDEAQKWLD